MKKIIIASAFIFTVAFVQAQSTPASPAVTTIQSSDPKCSGGDTDKKMSSKDKKECEKQCAAKSSTSSSSETMSAEHSTAGATAHSKKDKNKSCSGNASKSCCQSKSKASAVVENQNQPAQQSAPADLTPKK